MNPELKIIENSSNLNASSYDPNTLVLFVEFKNGGLYQYDGVSIDIAKEFEESESKGSYLAKKIKGIYPCRQLKKDELEPALDNNEKNVENNA